MKVTIITIVRNAENYIERTLRSVILQDYDDIEYIVIDGASSDNTIDILNKYKENISILISEPDKGISDAWNKGLALATGDIISLLNAGDEHDPTSVSRAVAAILAGADITFGDTELVDDDGRVLRINRGRFHLWWYSAGFGFSHPSVFSRKALYGKIGGFNVKCRFAMDSDWISRAVQSEAIIRYAGNRTKMVDGGVSVSNRFLAYGEHLQALATFKNMPMLAYKSMLMTGLRGLVSQTIRALRNSFFSK